MCLAIPPPKTSTFTPCFLLTRSLWQFYNDQPGMNRAKLASVSEGLPSSGFIGHSAMTCTPVYCHKPWCRSNSSLQHQRGITIFQCLCYLPQKTWPPIMMSLWLSCSRANYKLVKGTTQVVKCPKLLSFLFSLAISTGVRRHCFFLFIFAFLRKNITINNEE